MQQATVANPNDKAEFVFSVLSRDFPAAGGWDVVANRHKGLSRVFGSQAPCGPSTPSGGAGPSSRLPVTTSFGRAAVAL